MTNTIKNLTLRIWRQDGPDAAGSFETYPIDEISEEASFLELLDILNERLITEGKEAIVFDHDCREGICGTCSLMINGQAHGPAARHRDVPAAHAQVPRRRQDLVEPWRARAFPIIRDLMGDRGAVRPHHRGRRLHHRRHRRRARRQPDADPQAGGRRGDGRRRVHRLRRVRRRLPERRGQPVHVAKDQPPQPAAAGPVGAARRTEAMVEAMDAHFGSCTNDGECEAACPK